MNPEKYRKSVSAARWSSQGKILGFAYRLPSPAVPLQTSALFIPQQGCLGRSLDDAGSDHCTDGVHCFSEKREGRQQQTFETHLFSGTGGSWSFSPEHGAA